MPGQSACIVSESAKQAKASQRVCELAQPRRLYEKDYEVKTLECIFFRQEYAEYFQERFRQIIFSRDRKYKKLPEF